MRYYIKEYLNQKYEIAAMDGYDAYVSIYNHEDIHLTSQQKETVSAWLLITSIITALVKKNVTTTVK